MATTTKYLNGFAESITANQASVINEYIKQTLINNKLKFEEVFDKQKLVHINYYLDHSENPNQIRQKYSNFTISFFKNEVISGIYRRYDKETYNLKNELIEKHIEVYNDGSPYPIYYRALDPLTSQLVYFEKSYFDEQNNITYEFIYDDLTGNFEKLTVLDPNNVVDTDHHIILPNEIGVGNNPYNFTWQGFEYYKNAEPIIPI
ncbi:hypothetical protein [Flavobacterium macacae]|uniref:Uncharacterized protein n=1 Tax=Flavobacterium macacae TaxID=2488993 RepID=A0A3P3WFR7_9FLAO|nr:hypothetical protein [Flavobacterium macacae]RRJ92886.1 hypothetical protein EG849_04670 [Flavobacterium macacae]